MAIYRLGELFCGPGGLAWGATNADIGRDDFGILSLNHFSPYFVYDAKNMNGDLNNNNRNNFWSMIKDFFITGDLKTKIIAWSSVGLILTAFGVLVFMKKYKKIK